MRSYELKWQHIDFKEKLYFIPNTDTKNKLYLELPLSNYLYKILSDHRNATPSSEQYVFYANNDYGYIREPKKIIKKVKDKSEIEFKIHDLRRTFTSIAETLNLGTSYTLKRLLNHKTNRNDVTAGYTILTAEELREPAQKIENKILELAGRPPPCTINNDTNTINDDLLKSIMNMTPEEQNELLGSIN